MVLQASSEGCGGRSQKIRRQARPPRGGLCLSRCGRKNRGLRVVACTPYPPNPTPKQAGLPSWTAQGGREGKRTRSHFSCDFFPRSVLFCLGRDSQLLGLWCRTARVFSAAVSILELFQRTAVCFDGRELGLFHTVLIGKRESLPTGRGAASESHREGHR